MRASNVVEDDRDATPPKPSRQGFVWLGAGLMVGAGLAVLFLRVDPPPEVTTTSSTLTASDTRVVTIAGIGEEIPGFPDGLIATKRSNGRSLELVIWPVSGDPSVRSVPFGVSSPPDPVAFDLSGRRLATVLPVPDEATGILYAGVPDAAAIISLDVTGYAWHDAVPEALAYTTSLSDGETALWVTRGNLAASDRVARAMGIEGGVAAWGDWGYAVQDREEVVLFSDTGEINVVGTGRILGSDGTGWLALDASGLMLMNTDGGLREIPNALGADNPILAASFSPTASVLGVLTGDGLTVISLDQEIEIAVASERPGVPQVVWSSDGRYALYPGLRGVIVVDISDGTVRKLMPTDIFTGLAVLNFEGA